MQETYHGQLNPLLSDALEWVVGVVRILIGTYFLAHVISLWISPEPHTAQTGLAGFHTFAVFLLALASAGILFNRAIKASLAMAAIYTLVTGFAFLEVSSSSAVISSFWRDFTVLSALALIALARPESKRTQKKLVGYQAEIRKIPQHVTA